MTVLQLLAQRSHDGDWTEAEILLLVRIRTFEISHYSPRHSALRVRCRDMVKRGLIRFVCEHRGKLYYRSAK